MAPTPGSGGSETPFDRVLREVVDALPAAAYTCDEGGRVTHFNRRLRELLGRESDTLTACDQLAAVAGSEGQEITLKRADGVAITALKSSSSLIDEERGTAIQVHVLVEITERKRAEQALAASELRFRALAEANPFVTWITDVQGATLHVNRHWSDYTGLKDKQRRGDWQSLVVLPEDYPKYSAALRRAHEEGIGFAVELRLRRHDGAYRWFLIRAEPLRDSEDRVVQWVASGADIENRKRSEDMMNFLSEASVVLGDIRKLDRTLKRLAHIAVPRFADWCEIVLRNGVDRRIVAHHLDPEKTRIAQELHERFPADDQRGARKVLRTGQPILVSNIQDSLIADVAQSKEHLELMRNLDLRSYLCVPIRSRKRIVGAMAFATAESGRTYSSYDLEAATELARRTSVAIENAELVQALKLSHQRKDEFLATLSHELRNPLAALRNSGHMMQTARPGSAAGDMKVLGELIDRQVRWMGRLIDDLFDVSRVASGKLELRKERFALQLALENAVEASGPLFADGQHRFVREVPAETIVMEGDPARITQIVANLLNNAAKFTPAGGRITLLVTRDDSHVSIRVQDTGIGIEPEMLDRIFDLYTQVEKDTPERQQGGLGLGLTLVKRLAELHGGTAEARSEGKGKGSEFTVRLPLRQREAVAAGPPAQATPEHRPEGGSHRILVVDDNVDTATSLGMLLSAQGYEVKLAYDGLQAVNAAVADDPEIILLDIGLPKLTGFEAARKIRELRGDEVALIAVTAWGQEEYRRRSKDAGFDQHMTKPVDPGELMKVIESSLERSSSRA